MLSKEKTIRLTLNVTPEMQESFLRSGIKDLTAKCMAELLNGGIQEIINQNKQLTKDLLYAVSKYRKTNTKVPLSFDIACELEKLKKEANVCKVCGLKLAIDKNKCANCLKKESTEITLNKLIELGVNNG